MGRRLAVSTLLLGSLLIANPLLGAELPAVADTWVHGARDYRTVNYGGGEFMKVRSRGPRIALIRFDTDSLPAGAGAGATLSLHVSRVVAAGTVQIRPVTSAWSESGVTYDTRPTIGSEVIGTIAVPSGAAGTRVSVDVSPLVESWIADPDGNFGLAITADSSPADVYFGTRDVGTAPELIVAATNTVTVSHSGGDYANPVDAANNAMSGDAWCVAPTQDEPCTMNIDEGLYVLPETLIVPAGVVVIGAGQTATVLVAARGLDLAVEATALTDLAIVNRQDSSVPRAIGFRPGDFPGFIPAPLEVPLTRVAVRTEGADENTAIEVGSSGHDIVLTESDVAAAGGRIAFGIDMNFGVDSVNVRMSRITATRATESNEGITKFVDSGGALIVTDSAIVASGGRQAAGISISDEDAGDVVVIGGTVTAFASEQAFGLSGGEVAQGLIVEGTRISVSGPGEAVGIAWSGAFRNDVTITDVIVDSSDVAVSHFLEDIENTLTITRSQLVGARRAVEIETGGVDVSIDDSVLQGEQWAGGRMSLTASDSLLDGEADVEGPLACTNVLGGDYEPLGDDCLPQE